MAWTGPGEALAASHKIMYRNRPYLVKAYGLLIALIVCIGLIWLMLNHPDQFLRMISPGSFSLGRPL